MRLRLLVCSCLILGAAAHARYQALWVDAFNPGFRTPEETRRLIELSRNSGVNALFVQVSKTADAYYQSQLLPAARELPPGYDPLADLLRQAHNSDGDKPRIEIHAWIICYRVATANEQTGALLQKQPGWLMTGFDGERRFDDQLYVDPGVPAVQEFYAALAAEIARNYAVDGVHLDRIRYPAGHAGYNPVSVQRFRRQYQLEIKPRPNHPQWNEFRRRQITGLVERVRLELARVRPSARLSVAAAVFKDFPGRFENSVIYRDFQQDWPSWSQNGALDLLCPMIYKREHVAEQQRDFRDWLRFAGGRGGGAQLLIGQGAFLNQPAGTLRQLELVSQLETADGFCLYSYANLTDDARQGAAPMLALLARQSWWSNNPGAPPSPPARLAGIIAGRVLQNELPIDGAPVSLRFENQTRSTRSDGNGYFVFCGLRAGSYQLAAPGTGAPLNIELPAGNLAERNLRIQ